MEAGITNSYSASSRLPTEWTASPQAPPGVTHIKPLRGRTAQSLNGHLFTCQVNLINIASYLYIIYYDYSHVLTVLFRVKCPLQAAIGFPPDAAPPATAAKGIPPEKNSNSASFDLFAYSSLSRYAVPHSSSIVRIWSRIGPRMIGVAQPNGITLPHAAHIDRNVTHNMIWILLIRMVISMVAFLCLFNRLVIFYSSMVSKQNPCQAISNTTD